MFQPRSMTNKTGFLKYFLFCTNFIFVLSSVVLIWVGLMVRGEYHRYREFLDERYFSAPVLMICIGALIFFVAFFGCCGAIQENYLMTLVFGVTLTVLFMLEMTVGLMGYTLSERAYMMLKTNLNDTMQMYGHQSKPLAIVWDGLQINLECCGVESYEDWYPVLNGSLPMSCCGPQVGTIGKQICDGQTPTLYDKPCLSALAEIIKDNATQVGCIGLTIALSQAVGIIFACSLARRLRLKYEKF